MRGPLKYIPSYPLSNNLDVSQYSLDLDEVEVAHYQDCSDGQEPEPDGLEGDGALELHAVLVESGGCLVHLLVLGVLLFDQIYHLFD